MINIRAMPVRYGDTAYRNEIPFTAMTGRLYLSYYRQRGLLQIINRRSGHSITIEQIDAQNNPTSLKLLSSILNDWGQC